MDEIDSPLQEPAENERAAAPSHGLAKEVEVLFQNRRLVEYVEVLNELLVKKYGDSKIMVQSVQCGGKRIQVTRKNVANGSVTSTRLPVVDRVVPPH